MLRTNLRDEYYDKQPPLDFVDDLKKTEVYKIDKKSRAPKGEVFFDKVFIGKNDFAEEKELQTAFDALNRFITENDIGGKNFSINIIKDGGIKRGSYKTAVNKNSVCIYASDKDSVRLATVRLIDCAVISGGCLKKGETVRSDVLKKRISRCFFSPINRPPKNIEELNCDIDFYPDGYLDTLMHRGVNVIWITSSFASLIKSSYITEFGEGCEKRIERLNKTIEKCALYGIKVYLLLIEPISLYEESVKTFYPELYKKYPQVAGNSTAGPTAFCTFTDFGEGYLKEAVTNLFLSAKKLGGIISITWGERVTSCANAWPDGKGEWKNNCPHCGDKSRAEIVSHTVKIITDAMKAVSPEAEFISWTYGHRGVPFREIEEYVKKIPENAALMQNFEDDGRVYQLGKKRFGLDYFLCYAGPSRMFEFTAEKAAENKKTLYAKMQVCCSHELATMPYIPVPGIIYDKITRAKKLGVTGVMESWFFGNYPCVMDKAVELLSDDTPYKNKREFLLTLSKLYFKRNNAATAAKAFSLFEKAYTNYPVNVMFNYYGPMHDGVVWEYALKPKNFSLPRTWKLEDRPDGDRIGECLFEGHTIDEAIRLCKKTSRLWTLGLREFEKIDEDNEIKRVAFALGVLFKSGLNALNFYKLRDELGYMTTKAPKKTLVKMQKIVEEEIKNSEIMQKCCKENNAFGYHSEAEGFKFFPEKLENRCEKLKTLLKTEFVEVKDRIENGLCPLAYYLGEEDGVAKYKAGKTLDCAEWQSIDDGISKFRLAVTEKTVEMEFCSEEKRDFFVCNEFKLMFPQPTYIFSKDGKVSLYRDARTHQSVLDEKVEKWQSLWQVKNLSENGNTRLIVTGDKNKIGFLRLPYKLLVKTDYGAYWQKDANPVRMLGKSTTSPCDFGWIV